MNLPNPLISATLLRRYKRFLADVRLSDGTQATVHCANPGAMTGLAEAGSRIWLSRSDNPKRKLAMSWELTELASGLVGVNTNLANRIVGEALRAEAIEPLQGYDGIRAEVPYDGGSRIDFLLEQAERPDCYLEVKSVTLSRQAGLVEFPDAATARGRKHLEALSRIAESGGRAVMLFLAQRGDCSDFTLAEDIDPAYARAFRQARAAGVEAFAYCCKVGRDQILLDRALAMLI